jgi:hypothetical protein
MYLTSEGAGLQARNQDLKSKKVEYLDENEVFDV